MTKFVNCYSTIDAIKFYIDDQLDGRRPVEPLRLYPQGQAARLAWDRVPYPGLDVPDGRLCLRRRPRILGLPDFLGEDTFIIAPYDVAFVASLLQGRADVVTPIWPSGKEHRDRDGYLVVYQADCSFDPDYWRAEFVEAAEDLAEAPDTARADLAFAHGIGLAPPRRARKWWELARDICKPLFLRG
jgi:hypothetical protein